MDGPSVALGAGLRVLILAVILVASCGLALGAGLLLARLGFLGTCQDGSCELVAAVYVMPIGGILLYFASLVVWSRLAKRQRNRDA
ncbi:hypothetical protein [Devosia ginsengisoli]|uniref:hypothetical protein n=1 Tax=Devosia ginsengisoli TaxID=400770 RepID=UPI001FE6F90B|nr:hypothetical protein [Devosia ginsengisoli]